MLCKLLHPKLKITILSHLVPPICCPCNHSGFFLHQFVLINSMKSKHILPFNPSAVLFQDERRELVAKWLLETEGSYVQGLQTIIQVNEFFSN